MGIPNFRKRLLAAVRNQSGWQINWCLTNERERAITKGKWELVANNHARREFYVDIFYDRSLIGSDLMSDRDLLRNVLEIHDAILKKLSTKYNLWNPAKLPA